MTAASIFQRYASIVPDYGAFCEALARPRALQIRVNSLRIDPAEFARAAAARGHALEPIPWAPNAFFAPGLVGAPLTLEYFLGLYYVQGATSMIPAIALDPRPGDRVLDLCAAPGSKATQIAEAMRGEGLVVANDLFVDRLRALKGHLERLGIACAVIARRPGDSFPGGVLFRRVLVDAPCTGEGTVRAAPARKEEDLEAAAPPARERDRERLYRLQRALLRRAANLCEPGGAIVYSTCTYSPLENEAAIDDVLSERDDLEIEEIPCGAPGDPGVVAWEGRRFRPEVARCRRYYPHRIDSWGFFVARLRRKESARAARAGEDARWAEPSFSAPADDPAARARVLRYFGERFGIPPEAFERYAIYEAGHAAWLASRAMPRLEALAPWNPQNAGIRLLRYLKGPAGPYEKPTSAGLALVGRAATRGVADLSGTELRAFLRGEPVRRPVPGLQGGYAIVRYAGWVVGCGLLTAEGLISQLPAGAGEAVGASLFLL